MGPKLESGELNSYRVDDWRVIGSHHSPGGGKMDGSCSGRGLYLGQATQ